MQPPNLHCNPPQDNIDFFNKAADTTNPDFEEGNKKHSINGYVFCNMPDVRRLLHACSSCLSLLTGAQCLGRSVA